LALDRRAFVAARQGNGSLGGAMLSPPYGVWGLTPKQLEVLPEFQKDIERNRAQARKLMAEAGYGPNKKLKVTYITRLNDPPHLTSSSLVADQLRNIYIEGEIEQKEYSVFSALQLKGAYTLAFNTLAASVDDPDVAFYQSYTCAARKYANVQRYCNPEMDAKIDEQSKTIDPVKRKQLVQEIDLQLQREVARPALYQYTGGTCWHPYVKSYVRSGNGLYTHNNLEDVWLDK
jgi:peptide/nickel transport system substrate-binding protein